MEDLTDKQIAKFWDNVFPAGFCWEWEGGTQSKGYGIFIIWRDGRHKGWKASRVAYYLLLGELPNLPLDHLCRNPICVNPDHLEPVTQKENVRRRYGPAGQNARKTHCSNGHLFSPENTKITKAGARRCRFCVTEWSKAAYEKRKRS